MSPRRVRARLVSGRSGASAGPDLARRGFFLRGKGPKCLPDSVVPEGWISVAVEPEETEMKTAQLLAVANQVVRNRSAHDSRKIRTVRAGRDKITEDGRQGGGGRKKRRCKQGIFM